jgi:hypothetical protein
MVSKKGLRAFFCFSRPPADEVLASRILVPPSLWPVDTGARSHAPATIRGKRPSSGKRAQFGIKSVSMRLTRSSQSHPARNVLYARYLQNLWITSDGTTGKRHPGCSWVECLNFELCLAATLHELAEFVRGQSAPNVATVKAGIELLSLLQWHRTGKCHEPEAVWVKAGRRAVIRRRQQTTFNRITSLAYRTFGHVEDDARAWAQSSLRQRPAIPNRRRTRSPTGNRPRIIPPPSVPALPSAKKSGLLNAARIMRLLTERSSRTCHQLLIAPAPLPDDII